MNISLVHSSSISKINSPYIYFGTSYKNILKLKKESNYPIINYEGEFFFLKDKLITPWNYQIPLLNNRFPIVTIQ